MIPTAKLTYVRDGFARLLEQYKRGTKYRGLIQSYLNQIQRVEDATQEVIFNRLLSNAVGVQLDAWAAIAGIGRGNLADEDLRLSIRITFLVNRSTGSGKDIGTILAMALTDSGFTAKMRRWRVATLEVILSGKPSTGFYQVLYFWLHRAKMGGVRLLMSYPTQTVGHRFKFAPYGSDGVYNDADQGFFDGAHGGGLFISTQEQ